MTRSYDDYKLSNPWDEEDEDLKREKQYEKELELAELRREEKKFEEFEKSQENNKDNEKD